MKTKVLCALITIFAITSNISAQSFRPKAKNKNYQQKKDSVKWEVQRILFEETFEKKNYKELDEKNAGLQNVPLIDINNIKKNYKNIESLGWCEMFCDITKIPFTLQQAKRRSKNKEMSDLHPNIFEYYHRFKVGKKTYETTLLYAEGIEPSVHFVKEEIRYHSVPDVRKWHAINLIYEPPKGYIPLDSKIDTMIVAENKNIIFLEKNEKCIISDGQEKDGDEVLISSKNRKEEKFALNEDFEINHEELPINIEAINEGRIQPCTLRVITQDEEKIFHLNVGETIQIKKRE